MISLSFWAGNKPKRTQIMIKYSEYKKAANRIALSDIKQTLANNDSMQLTKEVENYLKIQLASQPDEWFAVLFLTIQHRLIPSERLFRGTVNSSHPMPG